MEELANLDADDEALNRWKQSLIKKDAVHSALPPGPHLPYFERDKGLKSRRVIGAKCQVTELAIVVEGREDMVIDLLSSKVQDAIAKKELKLTFKEGAEYRMRVKFMYASFSYYQRCPASIHKAMNTVSRTLWSVSSFFKWSKRGLSPSTRQRK